VSLPRLSRAHWPADAYRRDALPERVLQFGTGRLLRALVAWAVDTANRAGTFNGRIVAVQSTPHGNANAIRAQDGLFTLVERGVLDGTPLERTRLVGAVSRALVAETEWQAVREVVTHPELQVIVSNVTEAGFRVDGEDGGGGGAPASYPAKLADLLHTRFTQLPDGPSLFVIPTELVPDNGPRLAAMVDRVAARAERGAGDEFRRWIEDHVRFCSSLVDRITTGTPLARELPALEARLGYTDAMLTITEPYAFWAIEGDPAALRAAFPIELPHPFPAQAVLLAPDISEYAERKLRLLNGLHTALAPVALLAGVRTVREAALHPSVGPFLRRVLFDELVPGTAVPAAAGEAFAASVIERLQNPWLEHEWRVIATNQIMKMRVRVGPAIMRLGAKRHRPPAGLALACAAHLRYLRPVSGGEPTREDAQGWWRGTRYPIVDADLRLVTRHWVTVDPDCAPGPLPRERLERLAALALADETLWGAPLAQIPGFLETTTQSLVALERDGVEAALAHD
jgi:tagaturonate reductase